MTPGSARWYHAVPVDSAQTRVTSEPARQPGSVRGGDAGLSSPWTLAAGRTLERAHEGPLEHGSRASRTHSLSASEPQLGSVTLTV